jgi:tripartite-type tricarboxylate transporter receptor subunit TctC
VHVPYRGETLVYNDMLGERVDVFFGNISGAFALYLDGKLKVLAVTDKARAAAMPDVPTTAEVGLPDLLSGVWYAMVGPPKLKPELQDQIAKATIEVLKSPMCSSASARSMSSRTAERLPKRLRSLRTKPGAGVR